MCYFSQQQTGEEAADKKRSKIPYASLLKALLGIHNNGSPSVTYRINVSISTIDAMTHLPINILISIVCIKFWTEKSILWLLGAFHLSKMHFLFCRGSRSAMFEIGTKVFVKFYYHSTRNFWKVFIDLIFKYSVYSNLSLKLWIRIVQNFLWTLILNYCFLTLT